MDASILEARVKRLEDALRGPIAKGLYDLMDSELGKLTTVDMITGALGPQWSQSQSLHAGGGMLARAYTVRNDPSHLHEEKTTADGFELTFGVKGGGKGTAGAYAAAQEYGAVITANPVGRARFFAAKFLETVGFAKSTTGAAKKRGSFGMQGLRGMIISLLKQGKGVPFWGIMALHVMKTGMTMIPARMHLRLAVREFNTNPDSKADITRWWVNNIVKAWNG